MRDGPPASQELAEKAEQEGLSCRASRAVIELDPFRLRARLDLGEPVPILEIPGDRLLQPFREAQRGLPGKLARDLAGIDRVAPVMARAILDELDQSRMGLEARARSDLVEHRAQLRHHLEIGHLRVAADIVGLAPLAFLDRGPKRAAMI